MNTSLHAVEHGFALGKFMPPHAGHVHLLRVAQQMSKRLTILVCSLPDDPIKGSLRAGWVRELFPRANVIHLATSMPQEPSEHPDFWNIWRSTINELVEGPIAGVFASESYGWRLASELGARFIPVDRARAMVPTSGTQVRHDPYGNWQYLPQAVRAHYAKRIAVLGPESVGKSTMTKRLAEHFDTVWVEEYARQLFDEFVEVGERAPGEFRYEDLDTVARGQHALEQSLAHRANKLLMTDTDVLTTMTWADHLYGQHETWFEEVISSSHYDLTLLLRPEGTLHVQDGGRIMVEQATRIKFADQLESNLKRFNRPYVRLTGSHQRRFVEAVDVIKSLFH